MFQLVLPAKAPDSLGPHLTQTVGPLWGCRMYDKAFGYNSLVPEDAREIFMWLCQDVAALHNKWHFYLELYSSEEHAALLSELALGSFNIIEESLRSDMTMSICRLSDPVKTAGKPNLSLQTLAKKCHGFDGLSELPDDFLEARDPVRRYRHKRVGHNDLNTTIKPHENPLPGIGRTQIDTILDLAGRVLNVVYQNFVDSESSFTPFLIGGADPLENRAIAKGQIVDCAPVEDRHPATVEIVPCALAVEEFVPDPSTALLFAGGLAGMAGYARLRWRRKPRS